MAPTQIFPEPEQILCGLHGSAVAWILGQRPHKKVIIVERIQEMEHLVGDFRSLYPKLNIFEFPPLPGTPYVPIPLHEGAVLQRQRVVQAAVQDEWDIIVTLPQVLLETFPTPQNMMVHKIECRVGNDLDPEELVTGLIRMGFNRVDMVSTPGEFAKRGAILDIFQPIEDNPIRIEFWDDTVEDIRIFNPETQRSLSQLQEFSLSPHYLWEVRRENIEIFSKIGSALWNQTQARKHFLSLVQDLQEKGSFQGYQHWAPTLFEDTVHLWGLLNGDYQVILQNAHELELFFGRYVEQLGLQEQEARSACHIWAEPTFLFQHPEYPTIAFPEGKMVVHLERNAPSAQGVQEFLTYPLVQSLIPKFGRDEMIEISNEQRILVYFQSKVLFKRFGDFYPHLKAIEYKGTRYPRKPGVYLLHGDLSKGFEWPDQKLMVLSERDLWPNHPRTKPGNHTQQWIDPESLDLKPGDYVVHEDHGIGRFEGLHDVKAGGFEFEMITLVYRHEDKIHLAFSQLSKIERLSSEVENLPQLDVLGGVRWQQAKLKAKKSLEDMADRLLSIYASRTLVNVEPCGEDDFIQKEFEEAFEYVPTRDQQISFQDIKADLCSGKPMDRLLIGDVGFGKTEVAMRMMFKLVNEGYQVALLCPTTVLAFQHYLTTRDRFQGFPVEVGFLSRLVGKKESEALLQKLRDGSCDIVIGTHRLFSRDIAFKNLGGLVVDEEQRFGVSHKERIKEIKKDIHVLSMSATPIPRTLNMALNGIRDISLMRTPPQNRLAITTTVTQFNERLIKNAIEFELSRGGQVYFIHNQIESMPKMMVLLKRLLPHATLGMAHGQMNGLKLESVMLKFINNQTDVLVATTLVENGMDVPNANTMLINRADHFGLSQLYQLRGRIGRSDRPAYAYLMTPTRGEITGRAKKRLKALEEFASLGSGFRLAALDLEIRGAGNMLGASQSGHIQAVGYQLYMKMMRATAARLHGRPDEIKTNPILNLKSHACIPKTFIEDGSQRLAIYKKISIAESLEDLKNQQEQIRDCFGPIPEPTLLLFDENKWRVELMEHKVLAIDREGKHLKVRFHAKAKLNPQRITNYLQSTPGAQLQPNGTFVLPLPAIDKTENVLEVARTQLNAII